MKQIVGGLYLLLAVLSLVLYIFDIAESKTIEMWITYWAFLILANIWVSTKKVKIGV